MEENIPARVQSSAIISAAPGSRSEGFKINVLPVTAAIGIVQRGIMLQGREYEADNSRDQYSRREIERRDATKSWSGQQHSCLCRKQQTWRIHPGVADESTYPCPSKLTYCVSSWSVWGHLEYSPSMVSPKSALGMPAMVSATCNPRSRSPWASMKSLEF